MNMVSQAEIVVIKERPAMTVIVKDKSLLSVKLNRNRKILSMSIPKMRPDESARIHIIITASIKNSPSVH
jgi:hypothetical protein